jgi:hypothetical protein
MSALTVKPNKRSDNVCNESYFDSLVAYKLIPQHEHDHAIFLLYYSLVEPQEIMHRRSEQDMAK